MWHPFGAFRRSTEQRLRPPRDDLAGMAPVWVVATMVSTVVATLGVQDIAARVTSPLHLDGRSADGKEQVVLALETRERPPAGNNKDGSAPVAPDRDDRTAPGPSEDGTPTTPPSDAVSVVTVEAATAGWEIATAPGSTTRWARGTDSQDGHPSHHLEYRDVQGAWQYGYGNNADTRLTSPWIDVPDGDGALSIAIWSRMFVEPELDGYVVSWSADGTTWQRLTHISGGEPDDPVQRRTHATDDAHADRIRVRLSFTSDEFGSAWDRDVPPPAFANGEHLEVHRIALVRASGTGLPLEDVGVPHRPLEPAPEDQPHVVMAVGGESINPYHPTFRDDSPRAYAHPSTYIDGYPRDAVAVWLSLDAPDFATAMRQDAAVWNALTEHQLYWFPGTRIVGAVVPTVRVSYEGCVPICIGVPTSCGYADEVAGIEAGTYCHYEQVEDEHVDAAALPAWRIDATHWAAAAAGDDVGTCRECLLVHVDSIGATGFRWPAAHADWIDVQVQHHVFDSAIDATGNWAVDEAVSDCADECALGLSEEVQAVSPRQLVVTNPQSIEQADPVYAQPLAGAPGAVTVAAHDRGHVAWAEPGSHVAVNHCGVLSTADRSLGFARRGTTLRMSTARAAGIYADALLQARRVLHDLGHGARGGALAVGDVGLTPAGPLADGRLTMHEWRRVVEATATPRPPSDARGPGCHDGTSRHAADDLGPNGFAPPTGLGTPWRDVPTTVPAHATIGFGAIDDPAARQMAMDVLHGSAVLPARPAVDAWFVEDERLRVAGMHARARLLR